MTPIGKRKKGMSASDSEDLAEGPEVGASDAEDMAEGPEKAKKKNARLAAMMSELRAPARR